MKIHLLFEPATKQQIEEMLEEYEDLIKCAVDIHRNILAGGGELHADCEAILLKNGSKQNNIWGAGWIPSKREVRLEAMLNINPRRNNPDMIILNPYVRAQVESIVRRLLDNRIGE